jgi:hypothetical protein
MTEIEEVRRIYEEEISPMLRSIHGVTSFADGRLDSQEGSFGLGDKHQDVAEQSSQYLYEKILLRLKCIQQSVVLHRRLFVLEADRRRSMSGSE